jgi:hypothetical protein
MKRATTATNPASASTSADSAHTCDQPITISDILDPRPTPHAAAEPLTRANTHA